MLSANGHALDEHVPVLPVRERLVITAALPAHIYALADTLREADRKEILDLGIPVKKALWRAFRNSVQCRVALLDDRIAALWGLGIGLRAGVSSLSDLGVPWLHTSAAIEDIPVSFLKHAKAEVAAMRKLRPRLESFVAADYAKAIRFVRALGFAVERPEPVGLNGALFCRFHCGFDA